MNRKILQQVAQAIRKEFEHGEVSCEVLINLYKKYHPIDDIEGFIEQSQELFPHLNCGIASVYLKHILQAGEVKRGKYRDENHSFLVIDKTTVVDITADQFGGPRVYVGSLQLPWVLSPT